MDPTLIGQMTKEQVGCIVSIPLRELNGSLFHVITGQRCLADVPEQHGALFCLHRWRVEKFVDECPMLVHMSFSTCCPIPENDLSHYVQCFEVCTGIGGTSWGALGAGFKPLVACDVSPLACDLLRLNQFPKVICGSIADLEVHQNIHVSLEGTNGGLLAGFPCQPFSRLGSNLQFKDPRADTFFKVLDLSVRLQVPWILLECVSAAGDSPIVRSTLDLYAEMRDFHWTSAILHLDRAWPAYRTRWWAFLVHKSLPLPDLRDFNINQGWQRLDQIITSWPCWSTEDEEQLILSQFEADHFFDDAYGNPQRALELQAKAPTFLHSMGAQLTSCPCGCRPPFRDQLLRSKGLHGVLMPSQAFPGTWRHPHPREASLIVGLPACLNYEGHTRAVLTQIGQIASPIQSHWILVQVASHWVTHDVSLPWVHAVTQPTPEQLHRRYLRQLLRGHQHAWPVHDAVARRKVQLIFEGEPPLSFHAEGIVTTKQLIEALHQELGCHDNWQFWQNGGLLQESDLVLEGVIFVTRPLLREGYGGLFPSEVTWNQPQCLGLGLDDLTMHQEGLRIMKSVSKDSSFWSPRYVAMIQELLKQKNALPLMSDLIPVEGELYALILVSQHWLCVHLSFSDKDMKVKIYDGLSQFDYAEVQQFLQGIFLLSGKSAYVEEIITLVPQSGGHHCGAIALTHLALAVSACEKVDEDFAIRWHQSLLEQQHHGRSGGGQITEEQREATLTWLRGFLPGKGVEVAQVETRIAAAVSRLGINTLHEAVHSSNPWKALKQAGSSNGRPFQWITPAELEAQIKARGTQKFKLKNGNPARKKNQQAKDVDMGLHLVPDNLQILDGAFIDDEDEPVTMIGFQEVISEARGIAICTVEQALQLNRMEKNLSIDALAVVSIGRLNLEEGTEHCSAHLQWPAVYLPTQEPILVSGTLLDFGDSSVRYNQPVDAPELPVMDTVTLRLMQFKDQYDGDWSAFVQGPVKAIVQAHHALQLCSDPKCTGRCSRFHPAVEEPTEVVLLDVWSWRWCSATGKAVAQKNSEAFSVYVRVPESAVAAILTSSGWTGFYAEPRSSVGFGAHEKFAVIWLPKFTWDEAQTLNRTHEAILGLARSGARFGVRVAKKDEEQTLQKIFPGRQWISCAIEQTYELGPLPPCTNKMQVMKLLAAWKWRARPLRPSRTTTLGKFWEVGTDMAPPSQFLHTEHGTLTVTQKKLAKLGPSDANVVHASLRTKQHIKKAPQYGGAQSSSSSAGPDPWQISDPWKGNPWATYRPTTTEGGHHQKETAKRIEDVTKQLRADIQKQFEEQKKQTSDEPMPDTGVITQLQADVVELKAQNHRFQEHFQEVGNKLGQVDRVLQEQSTALQEVHHGLHAQRQTTEGLEARIMDHMTQQNTALTNRLEALLEKRAKTN